MTHLKRARPFGSKKCCFTEKKNDDLATSDA